MLCPNCLKSETRVLDSRDDGKAIRRRRECLKCKNRFTTYERIETPRLYVIKKDGRREPFLKEKLLTGLKKACEKRPICLTTIEEVADRIERELHDKGEKEVPSKLIGQLVMNELKKLDEVAYIRFASVYKAFKDAEGFEKEVHKFLKR
jgi:transcriptional repressor NrdR